MAKVFNINVTNTIDGGASSCLPCPQVSVLVAALLLRDEITHPLSICAFSKSCFRSGCDTSKLNYFKLDSTILQRYICMSEVDKMQKTSNQTYTFFLYIQTSEAAGCIPCPAGQYIENSTTECTPCPANTVVTDPLPYGPQSCLPCGVGLTAPDHLTCIVQCRLTVDNYTYDLTNISR